ncbi:putative RNA recognition motif domain, nucleotide-binding alpha-beta plait domain superfamily [Helianthus annuus]|nr:putative RNA recognition motif domain, nucleotide-binding alpha-beta plait domain superfamily [Helianthus annuus]
MNLLVLVPSIVLFISSSRSVEDTSKAMAFDNVIFVDELPSYLTADQAVEFLETFGTIAAFYLVVDEETGNSKGHALFIYQDISVTDLACAALNGYKMGDKPLLIGRANQIFARANQKFGPESLQSALQVLLSTFCCTCLQVKGAGVKLL